MNSTVARVGKQQQQDLSQSSVSPREDGVLVPASPSPESSARQGVVEHSQTEGGASLAAAEGTKLWDVLMGLKKGRRGVKPQPHRPTDSSDGRTSSANKSAPAPADGSPLDGKGDAVGNSKGGDVATRKRALALTMCAAGRSNGSNDDEGVGRDKSKGSRVVRFSTTGDVEGN